MNLEIEVGALEGFGAGLIQWAESLRVPVQSDMAAMLRAITIYNFGEEGVNRPVSWRELSMGYAKTHHGGDQTPTLVLGGDLRESIQMDASNPDGARVFTENPYAAIHQWGLENEQGFRMSPRPFFPLDGDENSAVLTDYADHEVRLAAEIAISEAISRF